MSNFGISNMIVVILVQYTIAKGKWEPGARGFQGLMLSAFTSIKFNPIFAFLHT